MALKQLNEQQIRDWTLEEKDRWWFENVWKGDMPQLTIRSALTGMLLGGVLSLTNLYIGAKTGWSLGVGITSVILAFSLFKILSSLKLSSEFSVLENNCMQSIATAAGYMTAPMTSSLAAYMMITGKTIPIWQTMAWIVVLGFLGVLFAFPLKRRFINDEQHPFPEGRAAGIVMDSLHTSDAKEGLIKGVLLAVSGGFAGLITLGTAHELMDKMRLGLFKIPETLDGWIYKIWSPKVFGLDPRQLGISAAPEVAMFGAGGLMGIKIGVSLIIGGLVNYFVLAPWIIQLGDIHPYEHPITHQVIYMNAETGRPVVKDDRTGQFVFREAYQAPLVDADKPLNEEGIIPTATTDTDTPDAVKAEAKAVEKNVAEELPVYEGKDIATGENLPMYGFRAITKWALWGGVAMMTAASLFAFFSKPKILISAFKGIFRRKKEGESEDVLKNIELPMRVFCIGIPLVGLAIVLLAKYMFDVDYWHGAIAIPLIFLFTLIGVNSTALTSITPTGALGKLTQLTYAGIAKGNITTNIATASITGEVAGHASNLLMDIKPGYMLGAKPRQQAIGHVLGIIAGAIFAVPVFYVVFMTPNPQDLVSDKYPMPSAVIWKSVAELLTEGISQLPMSARWAILVGIILGLACEILKLLTKGRFWLSGVGMGLAMVLPFQDCLTMFAGALFFWLLGVIWKNPESQMNRVIVKNIEAICAGLIAGGALMGILVKVITTFVL